MFFSVVIPTYNRKPILEKCLLALEGQVWSAGVPIDGYEVVVVDDGSTDGTVDWLTHIALPHVRLLKQAHLGPAAARNLGVEQSKGDTIIFIDSDLVVTPVFLEAHATALAPDDCAFTYGRVINTCNFENPTAEPYKVTDFSAAYFATGNVAIARHWLEKAGLFDTRFQLYGWEDLELGVRLKQLGLKLIKCPDAVGYHWHPPFALDQFPNLIHKEMQADDGGAVLSKAPLLDRAAHDPDDLAAPILWRAAFGGRLNERTMAPLLQWLIDQGKPQLGAGGGAGILELVQRPGRV